SSFVSPLALSPFPTRRSSDLEHLAERTVDVRESAGGIDDGHARRHGFFNRLTKRHFCKQPRFVALSISNVDATADETCKLAVSADRKSTRLNSSHVKISYAVF